ncbi:unnamed protein product [Cunninghamella blakesleeana]
MGASHSKRNKENPNRQSIVPTMSSNSSTTTRSTNQQPSISSNEISIPPTRPTIFAGVQSNSFFLPKDWQAEDEEHGLHYALKQLFASNILSLVLPKFIAKARIIEIGCCRGTWILDMATQFPECEFIGFDDSIEKLPDGLPPLPNVQFELASITKETPRLPLEDESVDVINIRSQNGFMDHDDWHRFFVEAYRILKVGGMIHIVDYCYKPKGTVFIESFVGTVQSIMTSLNRDTERAKKFGPQLSSFGFQVIQSLSKKVHFGSDGKLSEAFTAVSLRRFDVMAPVLAPAMGLSKEDYRNRVEMVVAQCVNNNSSITWYAYAAKKLPKSSS